MAEQDNKPSTIGAAKQALEIANSLKNKYILDSIKNLWGTIENRTTKGFPPADQWTGQEVRDSVQLGPGMALPMFGRLAGGAGAGELGVFGGKGGGKGKGGKEGRPPEKPGPFDWSKAENFLIKQVQKDPVTNKYPSNKILIQKFRERFPEYQGKDSTIRDQIYNFMQRHEMGRRINTPVREPVPFEALEFLSKNSPVDENWVRAWARDADVKTKFRGGRGSTVYGELIPENMPYSGINPTVRLPVDRDRHLSTRMSPNSVGNMFDTGTGWPKPHLEPLITEGTTINKAGQSYANPEALDAALKYALSKAPTPARFGQPGNWLISEDMLPKGFKQSQVPVTEVPGVLRPDPNQLIMEALFKGGT